MDLGSEFCYRRYISRRVRQSSIQRYRLNRSNIKAEVFLYNKCCKSKLMHDPQGIYEPSKVCPSGVSKLGLESVF